MAISSTRRKLVWIVAIVGVGIIGFMIAMKIWLTATVFFSNPEDMPAAAAQDEPLDAQEQVVRNMVSPMTPGTPVMPDGELAINPSDYSRDLARFIPIDIGMDRYSATDELLLYYNQSPDEEGAERAAVSSSERMINGATLFVIRRSGLADDSIAAEETFALFDADKLVEFGSRLQCRRGNTRNQWTTELCP